MQAFLLKLLPFIFLGIMLVIFAAGIVLLSYVLIIGAIIGFILFCIAWVKDFLTRSKKTTVLPKSRTSRTIDHDKL